MILSMTPLYKLEANKKVLVK